MQKTFVTYLLYQHSQYAAFDRPNKTDVIGYQGDLKISKTDVKVQWLDRDQRKMKKTKIAQWFLAVGKRVKHCIGTKIGVWFDLQIPICKHHKM